MADTNLLAQYIQYSQPKKIDYEEYYEYQDEMAEREWRDNIDE